MRRSIATQNPVITGPDGWPLWVSPVRAGATTALRHHRILPLLATWTDDNLRVISDLEGHSKVG